MESIYIAFDVVTLVITTILCAKNIKGLFKSSRFLVYFIFVVIYVAPLYLDYIIGMPVYNETRYRGFDISEYDSVTRCIYDAVVIFIQFVILKYNQVKWQNYNDDQEDSFGIREIQSSSVMKLVSAFMVVPVIGTMIFIRRPYILYTPLWREVLFTSELSNYATFERLSYVGMACCVVIILTKNTSIVKKGLAGILLYSNMCIEGKKSGFIFIIMVSLILLVSLLNNKSASLTKRRKMLFRYTILAVMAVLVIIRITIYVKTTSRGYISTDIDRLYTGFRIDVFRDDRLRLAIYQLLHLNDYQRVPFPGHTYLISFLYYFPLDYISGMLGVKRVLNMHTYSDYLSAALYGSTVEVIPGFMTPAMLAELIGNFSILGIVVFPFICLWFARKIDKFEYPINVFIICSFFMLQMYSLSYIAYLLEFTLLICISKKVKFKIKR